LEKELTANALATLVDHGYSFAVGRVMDGIHENSPKVILLTPVKGQDAPAELPAGYDFCVKFGSGALQLIYDRPGFKVLLAVEDGLPESDDTAGSQDPGIQYSEDFFEQVFDSIKDYSVFTTTVSGKLNSWNTGAEHLFGYTKEEAIGLHFSVLFSEEDQMNKVPEELMETALKDGKALNEHFHRRKDGSLFWCNGTIFPLFDEQSRHKGFTKVIKDLEEKKLTERQVDKAKALSASIIAAAKEPIVILDGNLVIKKASKSFYELFGIDEKPTKGKGIYNFVDGLDRERLRYLFENALSRSAVCKNFEFHFSPEDGKDKVFMLHASKTKSDFSNNTDMYIVFIDDVTEERMIHQEKDDFISIATHELKTPLTLIKASAQMLQRTSEYERLPPLRRHLGRILEQTEKVLLLAGHLLDVSNIKTGRFTLKKDTFSLCELLAGLVDDFRTINTEHEIRLDLDGTCLVYADKIKIAQVLTNLLSNALKYSPDSNEIWVSISMSDDEKNAEVSVRDAGVGIPEAEASRIFKRFSRTRTVEEKNISGIGLGLYISAEIIKKHNGRIWFESRAGEGTTFFVNLPLA